MIPRRTAEEKDIFFSDLGKLHFHRLDVLLWLLGSPSYVRHVFRFCALALFSCPCGSVAGGSSGTIARSRAMGKKRRRVEEEGEAEGLSKTSRYDARWKK